MQLSHIPAYCFDFNLMTLVNNNNIVSNPVNKFFQTDSNGKQFWGDAVSSSIPDNTITTAMLQNNIITTAKIIDG